MLENRLLKVSEAAKILGMHPQSIYNGIARKSKYPINIKVVRIGRRVRIPYSEIERIMKGE